MQHRGNLHRLVAFLGIIVLIMSAHAQANKPEPAFTLIENGRSLGVIYLASGATPTAKMAAEELRDHLQKISGAVVPIVDTLPADPTTPVILVGPSEAATSRGGGVELKSEGYRIKSGNNWLVLLGDDTPEAPQFNGDWKMPPTRYGTLTAVYRFLETVCGIRWFMPGEIGTVAPSMRTLRVPPLDLMGAPAFDERLPRLRGHNAPISPEQKKQIADWMPRVGFGKPFISHFNHSFDYLTKDKELQKNKPQIFAQLPDGSRDFNTTSYGHGNLCLSEPETLVQFVKFLRLAFDQIPDRREFSINPNDVWIPCACDKCMAAIEPELRTKVRQGGTKMERGTVRMNLSPEEMKEFRTAASKVFWQFVVQAARQIQESHPDRLIGVFGGYEGYGDPLVAGRFDLPSNIAICITKSRWNFWNHADRDLVRRMIEDWSKLVDHIYIWEYYLWNTRDWPNRPKLAGYPVFFPHIVQDDIRFARDHHVRGEKFQNENWVGISPGLNHLMPYLTGRLLYNPDLEVNELLDDYYSKFYGPAREEMKAFWAHAEACWMRDTSGLNYRTQATEMIETLFTVEDLRQFFSLLAAAKTKVAADSPEFRRIDLIEKEMAPSRSRMSAQRPMAPRFSSAAVFPPPVIDGAYHDDWGNGFIDLVACKVKVGHDPQNLYLSFAVTDGKVVSPSQVDGGKWVWKSNEDRWMPRGESNTVMIEIQLDPVNAKRQFAIMINASGETFTAAYGDPAIADPRAWQSGVRKSVKKVNDKSWSGTVAIPWKALGIKLSPAMEIKANISHWRAGTGVRHWSLPSDTPVAAKQPAPAKEHFGTISFPEQ